MCDQIKNGAKNELFTRQEIEQILQNMLGTQQTGRLHDYKVEAEPGPVGFLGEYFHLHLSYHLEREPLIMQRTRLFVKTMPYQNAGMYAFIEESGIMRKEAALYRRLLNKMRQLTATVWCAECYYTRQDLFVLQNIADLGYEPMHNSKGFLELPQLKVLLKGLATMHACSIAYEVENETNIGEELKDVLYEVTVSPTVPWYTAGVRATLAVALEHPAYQSLKAQSFIKNQLPSLLDTVYDMVNPSKKYRNVFCHRDPWGGNIFYSKTAPHNTPTAFVDFQLCRYCPAAIDVLMAIFLNVEPSKRKDIAHECYQSYFADFEVAMQSMGFKANAHMTQSDFEYSIEDLKLFGVLYNCISATILRVPGDYLMEMKQNRPVDFHRYTNIDRTKEVLELVRTAEDFRVYMFDCIEELMNLVFSN